MARVRAGTEVVFENGERPVAVLHAAEPERRSISECIALAKAHEEETGRAPVLDASVIIDSRRTQRPALLGKILEQMKAVQSEIGVSVVTIAELALNENPAAGVPRAGVGLCSLDVRQSGIHTSLRLATGLTRQEEKRRG